MTDKNNSINLITKDPGGSKVESNGYKMMIHLVSEG